VVLITKYPVNLCAQPPQRRQQIVRRHDLPLHRHRAQNTCSITKLWVPVLKNVGKSQPIQDFDRHTYVTEVAPSFSCWSSSTPDTSSSCRCQHNGALMMRRARHLLATAPQ
jgi:hypothetical protein